MSTLYDSLVACFDRMGWPYEAHADAPVLEWGYGGSSASFKGLAVVHDERILRIVSMSPVKCPAERRAAACEYIIRANHQTLFPGLVMDLADGGVRHESYIDAVGTELNTQLIENLVEDNFLAFDVHLRGLLKVILANVDPAEALEESKDRERHQLGQDAGGEHGDAPTELVNVEDGAIDDESRDSIPCSEDELAEARDHVLQMLEGVLAEAAAAQATSDSAPHGGAGAPFEAANDVTVEGEEEPTA